MKSTSFDEEQYFRSLPPGVWFDPNDHELIEGYLIKKINGLELPRNRIRDVNLYGYSTPENLVENYELIREKAWFFFTPRNKKYMNGKRPDRSTSGGVWRATVGEAEIRNNDNIVVGYKQVLKFFAKNPNHHQAANSRTNQWIPTDWLMHEYRVSDDTTTRRSSINGDAMKLDECVLCKVYKKSEQVKKREANKSSKSTNNKRAKKTVDAADESHQQQQPLADQFMVEQQNINAQGQQYILPAAAQYYNLQEQNVNAQAQQPIPEAPSNIQPAQMTMIDSCAPLMMVSAQVQQHTPAAHNNLLPAQMMINSEQYLYMEQNVNAHVQQHTPAAHNNLQPPAQMMIDSEQFYMGHEQAHHATQMVDYPSSLTMDPHDSTMPWLLPETDESRMQSLPSMCMLQNYDVSIDEILRSMEQGDEVVQQRNNSPLLDDSTANHVDFPIMDQERTAQTYNEYHNLIQ